MWRTREEEQSNLEVRDASHEPVHLAYEEKGKPTRAIENDKRKRPIYASAQLGWNHQGHFHTSTLGLSSTVSTQLKLRDTHASREEAIDQLCYKTAVGGGKGLIHLLCEQPQGMGLVKNCWHTITWVPARLRDFDKIMSRVIVSEQKSRSG